MVTTSTPGVENGNACPHFPACGGCDFRDKTYSEQLEYKEKFCRNLLARFNVPEFPPMIPSPQSGHYRHKMDFCAGVSPAGILLGMRQKSRSTGVVDIKECPVFFRGLGDILEIFREWAGRNAVPAYELYKHCGRFRYVSLRHSKSTGKVMVTGAFAFSEEEFEAKKEIFRELAGELQKVPEVSSIYICLNNKLSDETLSSDLRLWQGEKYIREKINAIEYLSSPEIFLQSNPLACAGLYGRIKLKAEEFARGGEVLDMYCGSGGITLQLADVCSRIKAVDNSPRNIEDARENAKLNKISNIDFICEDAEAYLERTAPGAFSAIILDPPRQGLSKKTLSAVARSGAKHIIYVSCNPLNLRQDLIALEGIYRPDSAVGVDMFPHTRHIEMVVTLTKL